MYEPIQIDAQRVHKFLTTLQEYGSCRITGIDGGTHRVLIDSELVTQALRFIHGDHKVSALKLSLEEKKTMFRMQEDSVTKMVYNNLVDTNVKLPL